MSTAQVINSIQASNLNVVLDGSGTVVSQDIASRKRSRTRLCNHCYNAKRKSYWILKIYGIPKKGIPFFSYYFYFT